MRGIRTFKGLRGLLLRWWIGTDTLDTQRALDHFGQITDSYPNGGYSFPGFRIFILEVKECLYVGAYKTLPPAHHRIYARPQRTLWGVPIEAVLDKFLLRSKRK